MATNKKKGQQQVAPEESIEAALGKTESFIQQNGKTMLIALIVVVVLVGGWFGVKYLYLNPRAEKAAEAMYVAEQLFAQEQFDTALNGDGNNAGFVEVVEQYGGTRQGRLAAHYAGICYIKAGDLESALTYLQRYKAVKGAPAAIINAQNFGLQGDIYSQQGDYNKAVTLYGKAVAAADNMLTTPYYLKKQGLVYEKLGDKQAALKSYKAVSENWPSSLEARDIDKYVGAIEQ